MCGCVGGGGMRGKLWGGYSGGVYAIWIIMGVSGCGKTTVGRALAARWGMAFYDADDFHPEANVAKMSAGVALDDADRGPWLDALNQLLRRCAESAHLAEQGEQGEQGEQAEQDVPNEKDKASPEKRGGVVLACSALKRVYRERLMRGLSGVCGDSDGKADGVVKLRGGGGHVGGWIYLRADYDTIFNRMQQREHFMPADLLRSQFEALEAPSADEAMVVDANGPMEAVVDEIDVRVMK